MDKVLNQEEIDAMVQAARSSAAHADPAGQPRVETWDVRRAGRIGREQLQAITHLHESFAEELSNSLAAYLRVVFSVALVSAEHLTYREFLQTIPEMTYLASCRLNPMKSHAALQLDLKVGFPIINLLLGGEGKVVEEVRDITEIEEQVLDSVAGIVCRELSAAWEAVSLDAHLENHLDTASAQRLMPPDEKILALSFEVTMSEIRGGLNLAVPVTVSNGLLRKISVDWTQHRSRISADFRCRLMGLLLDCPFEVELGAREVRIALGRLAELASSRHLAFSRRVDEPASLVVAGKPLFQAIPARLGTSRAARLLAPEAQHDRGGSTDSK